LGFKEEIDLVTFCVATAFYTKLKDGEIELDDQVSLKEMAKMYSFGKSKLYDLLVLNFLDTKENRLELFEKYFCAGFKILRRWFSENESGVITNTGLERICGIIESISEEKDDND